LEVINKNAKERKKQKDKNDEEVKKLNESMEDIKKNRIDSNNRVNDRFKNHFK
jgi:hypothetical protein